MTEKEQLQPKFQIFRGKDALDIMSAGAAKAATYSPLEIERLMSIQGEGRSNGTEIRVMFNMPGFSLTHVWFKKNYPLPLHSHDADCLYYIVAGTVRLGTETLGPRDGFFVGAGVPYTFVPGPEGVELLEFRHATSVDFKLHAHGEAFWTRAVETVAANKADWENAKMPTLNVEE